MQNLRIQIGKRIRMLRQRQGYTQGEFAAKAGLNPGNYGKLERGQTNVSLDVLETVAQTLNVSWLELMDCEHAKDRAELLREMQARLQDATDEQVQIAYRIMMDLLV